MTTLVIWTFIIIHTSGKERRVVDETSYRIDSNWWNSRRRRRRRRVVITCEFCVSSRPREANCLGGIEAERERERNIIVISVLGKTLCRQGSGLAKRKARTLPGAPPAPKNLSLLSCYLFLLFSHWRQKIIPGISVPIHLSTKRFNSMQEWP